MSLWEPFTERARRVMVLAKEEAKRLGNNYVGTEHLFLGIISEGESIAGKFLLSKNITLSKVRQEVENVIGINYTNYTNLITEELFLTPRTKKVLELSFEFQINRTYLISEICWQKKRPLHFSSGYFAKNENKEES